MHDAPAWVTLTVWPATVRVPVRGVLAMFSVTENCATPPPARLLPVVIAIHAALLVADQGQPFAVLTVIELAPAPAAMATFDVETS